MASVPVSMVAHVFSTSQAMTLSTHALVLLATLVSSVKVTWHNVNFD